MSQGGIWTITCHHSIAATLKYGYKVQGFTSICPRSCAMAKNVMFDSCADDENGSHLGIQDGGPR
jgi:hypothetical protein